MNGAKVYIGDEHCGTVNEPPQGGWYTLNCKAKGNFIKIQGTPGQYLHFCGLRIWSYTGSEEILEEEPDEPEPVKPLKTSTGHTVQPAPAAPQNDWITASSLWNDARNKPWNVIKSLNFNAHWGQGDFTCFATNADKEGPWWQAKFGAEVTITKVQILNRGDCCGSRLNKAKVYVGETVCGTIDNAP